MPRKKTFWADIAETRGSITTFYCISISFPGEQRKGQGRGKVGDRERVEIASGGSIIRGGRGEKRKSLSFSFSRAKKTVSEIIRGCVKSGGAGLFGPINGA